MWLKTIHLASDKRLYAFIAVAVLILAILGSIGLAPVLGGAGGSGPRRTYAVTFEVLGNESEVAAGSLPYDAQVVQMFNVTNSNLTSVKGRIEWRDEGRTPLQDPYVNLAIDSRLDQNLSTIDEIGAPGGFLIVEVPNEIPSNATVSASSEDEAISVVASEVNNTTAGTGEWWIRVSAQAPSRARPYVGGEIYYRIWVTLFFYEGSAIETNSK